MQKIILDTIRTHLFYFPPIILLVSFIHSFVLLLMLSFLLFIPFYKSKKNFNSTYIRRIFGWKNKKKEIQNKNAVIKTDKTAHGKIYISISEKKKSKAICFVCLCVCVVFNFCLFSPNTKHVKTIPPTTLNTKHQNFVLFTFDYEICPFNSSLNDYEIFFFFVCCLTCFVNCLHFSCFGLFCVFFFFFSLCFVLCVQIVFHCDFPICICLSVNFLFFLYLSLCF